MRYFLAFSLVLSAALPACGKKDDKSAAPAPEPAAEKVMSEPPMKPKAAKQPTGTARPQGKLQVTYDGKPVEMKQALAWKAPDGSIKLTASSVAVGCGEVTGDMRSLYDGEVTFDVELGQQLQPDGKLAPVIRQYYFDGSTTAKPAPATATGDGSPGQPTTVDVDLTAEGVSMHGPSHKLTAKGTIDALGCDAAAKKDAPALPAEMKATIEVAGKKLPIRGAVFSKVGDWPSLSLTTGGETCARAMGEQPSELRVDLTWFKAADPAVSQVSLGGTLLPNASDQTFDKKKLTVKPVPAGEGDVELKGEIKVMGYPVKLDGKVHAVVCPK